MTPLDPGQPAAHDGVPLRAEPSPQPDFARGYALGIADAATMLRTVTAQRLAEANPNVPQALADAIAEAMVFMANAIGALHPPPDPHAQEGLAWPSP